MSSEGPTINVNQACAACKHQRRKCSDSCPLAPFFPSSTHTQKFQNVHKLFGVSNVLKLLKPINPEFWPVAMETIQFQADARRNDPVHGCLGVIHQLNAQIQAFRVELEKARQKLSYYRRRDQNLMLQHQLRNASGSSSFPILPLTVYNNQIPNSILFDSANKNHNIGQRKTITYSQSLQASVELKPSTQMTQTEVIEISESEESSAESAAGEMPRMKSKNEVEASSTPISKRRGKQLVEN